MQSGNLSGGMRVLCRGQADLNGDGRSECVTLAGRPVSEGGFSEDMVLLIRDGASGKTSRVQPPLSGGYTPALTFVNLTSSGCRDILLSIPTGGSGGIINAYVYAYVKATPRLLFDSEVYNREYGYAVSYRENCDAVVDSLKNGQRYRLDLSRGAPCDADGEPQAEGFVSPLSGLYPIDFGGVGVYQLLAYQQISGGYRADSLGYVLNTLAWDGQGFALSNQNVAILGNPIPS